MTMNSVVSEAEWMEARRALLAREKALTQRQDELAAERQKLPWVRVGKEYRFDSPEGETTLAELFGDKSQLMIYHFMFAPEWEQGCPSCSMAADTMNANYAHLTSRDVAFTMVSRAPMEKIATFKERMGWTVPWVSSHGTDFNYDFGVSYREGKPKNRWYNFETGWHPSDEAPGASMFAMDGQGAIYHTYSAYARGFEAILGVYTMLDMAPKGRDEDGLPWPMAWVKHHDLYESAKPAESVCAHER